MRTDTEGQPAWWISCCFSTAMLFLLSGCASLQSTTAGIPASGRVIGGQQPVAGSHVYLMSAGETGLMSASTSLILPGGSGVSTDQRGFGYVTTGADGSFNVSGLYGSCADPASQTYVVAVGGNPGAAAGTNNGALVLVALTGPCGQLSPSQTLTLNELTTVAFASSFAPYSADVWHVGAPANMAGVMNDAAAAASMLVAVSPGSANAVAGAETLPQSAVNTLGNALSICVNSTSAASDGCVKLFAAATPAGGASPSDTFGSALSIAANPGSNIQAIYALGVPASAFEPTLTSAPADWTLGPQIPETVATVAGVTELGDSISTIAPGDGATPYQNSYASLLGTYLRGETVYSQGGDEAIDLANKAWYDAAPASAGNAPLTVMIGTNDVAFEDTGATNASHEQVYRDTLMAAVSVWLTPAANKLLPRNSAACGGSGWTGDGSFPGAQNDAGVYTTTVGAPFTCTFTSYGAPIYMWHLVTASAGTGSVSIDGVACGTFLTGYPDYSGSHNGIYNTIAAVRCPASAGVHTVTVEMTSGSDIGFEGLGTPLSAPLGSAAPPRMYGWGMLHELNDASAGVTLLYDKMFENVVAQMAVDGYLVSATNVRDHVTYMGSADPDSTGAAGSSCMANGLHPANCGHVQIADVLEGVIPVAP